MSNIKEYIKKAYENAVNKGFYDCPKCKGTGYKDQLMGKKYDGEKCEVCNGDGINPFMNIGERFMLINTELSEAFEAYRNNKFADWNRKEETYKCLLLSGMTKEGADLDAFKLVIKDTVQDEIADTLIRLFDLCGYLKIDIETFIDAKMLYNKTRPYKHGKKC